jgi:hypothetical protein
MLLFFQKICRSATLANCLGRGDSHAIAIVLRVFVDGMDRMSAVGKPRLPALTAGGWGAPVAGLRRSAGRAFARGRQPRPPPVRRTPIFLTCGATLGRSRNG